MNGLARIYVFRGRCAHILYLHFYIWFCHFIFAGCELSEAVFETMAQEVAVTMRGILEKLLPVLEQIEGDSPRFKESLAALQDICHTKAIFGPGDVSSAQVSCCNLLHLLATCLNESRILKSDHLSEAFSILADISREREWDLSQPPALADAAQRRGDKVSVNASHTRAVLDGHLIPNTNLMVTAMNSGRRVNPSLFSRSRLGHCTHVTLDVLGKPPTMPFVLYRIVVQIMVSEHTLHIVWQHPNHHKI